MLEGQLHTNYPPEHPTMSQINRNQNGSHICKKGVFGYGLNHNISRMFQRKSAPSVRGGGGLLCEEVRDVCRLTLGYKSRILVSLRVLMMKRHHF